MVSIVRDLALQEEKCYFSASTNDFTEAHTPTTAHHDAPNVHPSHSLEKVSIVGSLRDREVACSASDRQGSNFESCVWRTVSSQSSHHPQEVLLAQFSLYVHKSGLKPDSFHFISFHSLEPLSSREL